MGIYDSMWSMTSHELYIKHNQLRRLKLPMEENMVKKKIIHKTIFNEEWLTTDVDERRYLCNQAVNITPEKGSYLWKNVTCKNCLKQN